MSRGEAGRGGGLGGGDTRVAYLNFGSGAEPGWAAVDRLNVMLVAVTRTDSKVYASQISSESPCEIEH